MPESADALAEPHESERWVQPALGVSAEPRWGHVDGLQIGLHPLRGPRGLVRIYAPYLDHPRDRLINFVAIEPVPAGDTERGFSELEHSALDGVQGKRFWSADSAAEADPHPATEPARGIVETVDGVEQLTVFVHSERFDNGAEVTLGVRFRADRPHEVTFTTLARDESVPLETCIVTATMGNFARLRRLHLADRTVTAGELWPSFAGDHFTERGRFGAAELRREGATAIVSATPDEVEPHAAEYAAGTAEHWKYVGVPAVQTWRVDDPDDALAVQVNGRYAYWMSRSPIPGGVAFENFELVEPFRQGREFTFAIEPLDPAAPASARLA